MRQAAALAVGLLIAAAPASASVAAEDPATPQTVSLEAVALPIVVDGKLVNYVFCSIQLGISPKADGAQVRAKEPYFRDDLVRAAHRKPFTRPDDYMRVDEAGVRAEVMRFAASTFGPGVVQSVVITKQTSQKLLGLPAVQPQRPREIVP